MEHGRHKPQQEHFLGTADIIARVKLAQGRPVQRLLGALRWPVVMALSAMLALMLLAVCWRSLTRQRPASSAAAHTLPALQHPPQDTAMPPNSGPQHHLGSHGPHASAAASVQVRVALLHHAGAIWLDGVKVADKKRVWSGHVAPGNHELSVRCLGQMMRHTFVVHKDPLTVTVDPAQHTFSVVSGNPARRGARLH